MVPRITTDSLETLVSSSQFLLRNTVSQTNPKLVHCCCTLSLCQLERCSIQRDRLVTRLCYSTKELLNCPNTTGRHQTFARKVLAPPPVFETADDKSGSNGRGSLPLPAITNHYHHRPHPFTEGKLTQKLNFPSVSGSFFVSCTISASKTICWSHFWHPLNNSRELFNISGWIIPKLSTTVDGKPNFLGEKTENANPLISNSAGLRYQTLGALGRPIWLEMSLTSSWRSLRPEARGYSYNLAARSARKSQEELPNWRVPQICKMQTVGWG